MKRLNEILIWILICAFALGLIGCTNDSEQQTPVRTPDEDIVEAVVTALPTETPTPHDPEPTPEEDVIGPAATATPRVLPTPPTPSPTPEPTPTPAPTEIPFSYYAPTVNMSFEELVGSLDDFNENDPNNESTFRMPAGYPSPDTYRIIVDLYWQVVLVYTKDENGEYTVPVRYMLCSTGSGRVGGETRTGVFKMQKTRVRFGKFASSPESAQYWSLIFSKTYFHSTLYNKRRDLSSVQKLSYESLGSKASHGCIRLTVPDARWIFYNICYDTEVEIRKGSKDDAETEAIRAQLKLAPWKDDALLSVANTPYTDNWTIDEVPTDMPYVHATQPPVKNS